MIHATLPEITAQTAPPRRHAPKPIAAPRANARSVRTETLAAPLTLAAVIVGALLLAIAIAIVTALGA
jgi:hypothetical protein